MTSLSNLSIVKNRTNCFLTLNMALKKKLFLFSMKKRDKWTRQISRFLICNRKVELFDLIYVDFFKTMCLKF